MNPCHTNTSPVEASFSIRGAARVAALGRPLGCFLLIVAVLLLPSAAAAKTNPYTKPDATWISIGGKVKSVSADRFILDYGDGLITVEMDDGDRDADAYKLLEGDKVTVHGRIDDGLYETATIEASSVYVHELGTYFYASSLDEEEFPVVTTMVPVTVSTVLQGTVTKVGKKEFKIDTGSREITVEVDEMAYDPLDDEGYQKVEKGDLVRVTGSMDKDFFEGRRFEAESVITLSS